MSTHANSRVATPNTAAQPKVVIPGPQHQPERPIQPQASSSRPPPSRPGSRATVASRDSTSSGYDVPAEIELQVLEAERLLKRARHAYERAKRTKQPEESLSQLEIDVLDAEYALEEAKDDRKQAVLEMRKKREESEEVRVRNLDNEMERSGVKREDGRDSRILEGGFHQRSQTLDIVVPHPQSAVDGNIAMAVSNLSQARQPEEGSIEFAQRQRAYQRFSVPPAQAQQVPQAHTFASALRLRGLAQRLRAEDLYHGTTTNIPDQRVQLIRGEIEGTLFVYDPNFPGDRVEFPEYPHGEYAGISAQFFNIRTRNQLEPTQAHTVTFQPPLGAAAAHNPPHSPIFTGASSEIQTSTPNQQKGNVPPTGPPGRPPDGVNPHGGGGGNPYGGGGGPFGGGGPPSGGNGPYGGGGGPPSGPPSGGGGNGGPPQGPHGNGGGGGPPSGYPGRGGNGGPPGGPPGGDPNGGSNGGGPPSRNGSAGGRGPNRNPNRNPFRDPWDQAHGQREATPFGAIPWDIEAHTTETFEYIVPDNGHSDLDLRERVFKTMATYIAYKLYSKQPIAGDVRNISKMLTNAMPALEPYKGQSSVILLETFLKAYVRQCIALGLTGPPRLQNDDGQWIVTAEDALRTILLGGSVTESASDWYESVVERVPPEFRMGMDANQHKRSFMEVFRGLFDRFITNAALYNLSKVWQKITYNIRGGIRKLFADLIVCAERMPAPPNEYNFKVAVIRRMPKVLMVEVTTDGITVESSTVDEIMQKAIAVEAGLEASAFYSTMAQGTGPIPKVRQNVGPVRHQVEDHAKMREMEQGRQQQWNNDFKRRMEDRRNSPRQDNRSGNRPPNDRPNNDRQKNVRFSFKSKDGSCYACGAFGHFMNDPKCPKKTERVHFARMMEDDEPDDETTFLISSEHDPGLALPSVGWNRRFKPAGFKPNQAAAFFGLAEPLLWFGLGLVSAAVNRFKP
ncbi:hypothetical protein V5O48_018783, partial [Marasmius crinis-equi]